MKLSQFKFKLPEDKIALHPAKYRDESRLMVVHKSTACKVDGKRAYDLARKGEDVELKAKTLIIDEIELLECNLPEIKIRVVCSKGTYIRALARDIGEALNSGAHLTGLIRTRVGDVRLEDCLSVESFPEWLDQQEIEEVINE